MKKKTTLGLSSEFNDLGSKFLHQHFIMMLERMGKSDKLVRSRIRNQTMFDLLHVLELIDNHQHTAGEHLLDLAVKSGYFLRPVNYELQTKKNDPPSSVSYLALRSLRIAKIMRVLRKELGGHSGYVFDVVVLNHEVKTQDDLDLIRMGLDIIQSHVGIGYVPNQSPLLALQSVAKSV